MVAGARSVRQWVALACGCAALAAAAQDPADYRNVTAGGSLRPGIYGRIAVRGNAPPPPVIYPKPILANTAIERLQREPVYLYVPPGQVRKWKLNCAKWGACDEPVLFVRIEQSPSRWGEWHLRRDQLAWEPRQPAH